MWHKSLSPATARKKPHNTDCSVKGQALVCTTALSNPACKSKKFSLPIHGGEQKVTDFQTNQHQILKIGERGKKKPSFVNGGGGLHLCEQMLITPIFAFITRQSCSPPPPPQLWDSCLQILLRRSESAELLVNDCSLTALWDKQDGQGTCNLQLMSSNTFLKPWAQMEGQRTLCTTDAWALQSYHSQFCQPRRESKLTTWLVQVIAMGETHTDIQGASKPLLAWPLIH